MKSRWLRKIMTSLIVVLLIAIGIVWLLLKASLPWLDGQFELLGLSVPVQIERDNNGYTTITAKNRLDMARATGYAHAQDRFFQMDLLRRSSAGELAALFGKRALSFDQQRRVHRMRARAARVLETMTSEELALLQAYSDGVNAGLNALRAPPFEYLLLRQRPEPWNLQDSILTVIAMYFDLQLSTVRQESQLAMLRDCMPPEMVEFLLPRGTQWDAPLIGQAITPPGIPVAEIFDSRLLNKQASNTAINPLPDYSNLLDIEHYVIGSNNWAVSGALTDHGAAMVSGDMHLDLNLPHIWYRLRLVLNPPEGQVNDQTPFDISGVSLPGLPFIVVGSNRNIAWGFTNSYGDFLDLVSLRMDPSDPTHYLTTEGYEALKLVTERIEVAGSEPVQIVVKESRWGPVVDKDHMNQPRVWRWVAHEPEAIGLNEFIQLETAETAEQAIQLAQRTGMPGQNFVVGDTHGNIAWTIIGIIPKRSPGFEGRMPEDWAASAVSWQGWAAAEDYPQLVNPSHNRIWTANGRVTSGEQLAVLGDGGYALGARAKQIRERLMALEQADEASLSQIQLDDEAVFLARWRRQLLALLDTTALAGNQYRQQLRTAVLNWSGHAAVDDAGYRLVREYRDHLRRLVMHGLTAHCAAVENKDGQRQDFTGSWQVEGPLWQLVNQQPDHMLPVGFDNWRAVMLAAVDQLIVSATDQVADLREYHWGLRTQLRMAHPLASALPVVGNLLSMPSQSLPGDRDMPRVQGRSYGASQRMTVAPGHEEDGYLQLPGGQSGHPLSPYFAAGHADWAEGKPTPFLPGNSVHSLVLTPPKS